jgi:hypothetical protein
MVFYCILWYSTVYYGILMYIMVLWCILWYTDVYYGSGLLCFRSGLLCFRSGLFCFCSGLLCFRSGLLCFRSGLLCFCSGLLYFNGQASLLLADNKCLHYSTVYYGILVYIMVFWCILRYSNVYYGILLYIIRRSFAHGVLSCRLNHMRRFIRFQCSGDDMPP